MRIIIDVALKFFTGVDGSMKNLHRTFHKKFFRFLKSE